MISWHNNDDFISGILQIAGWLKLMQRAPSRKKLCLMVKVLTGKI